MKVGVTGATGHLAANLLPLLLEEGFDVRAVTLEPLDVTPPALRGLEVERVRAEITDAAQVRDALTGCDLVYHLAARISMDRRDEDAVFATNVEGTRNVVDSCLVNGVRRLVHVSSVTSIASTRRAVVEHGPMSADPSLSAYARSKATSEEIVRAAGDRGLDTLIVNPTGMVGPNDHAPSVFGRMLLDLWRGKIPAVPRGGTNVVDIRDVARTMVNASTRGGSGERYLVGGSWISVIEIAELSAELFGTPVPRFILPPRMAKLAAHAAERIDRLLRRRGNFTVHSIEALSQHRLVLSTRAMDELYHHPRPFERTLMDTFKWFADNGYLEGLARPVAAQRT